MKKVFTIIISLLLFSFCFGQQKDKNIAVAEIKNAIHILKNDKKYTEIPVKNAYSSLVFNFCYAKEYQEVLKDFISEDSLFQIIENYKDRFPYTYYKGFLLIQSGCFTKKEYDYIKNTLRTSLTFSNEFFYELVGIYELVEFKDTIKNNIDTTWFSNFSKEFSTSFFPYEYYKKVIPYTALANLGDKLIEEKIIQLLLNYTDSFDLVLPNKEEVGLQYKLYHDILPYTLGNLYSKHSILSTLNMLDNCINWGNYFPISDVGSSPMNYYYIYFSFPQKLHPIYHNTFLRNAYFSISVEDVNERKLAIENLKARIQQNEIQWSNLYYYWKLK